MGKTVKHNIGNFRVELSDGGKCPYIRVTTVTEYWECTLRPGTPMYARLESFDYGDKEKISYLEVELAMMYMASTVIDPGLTRAFLDHIGILIEKAEPGKDLDKSEWEGLKTAYSINDGGLPEA